MRQWVSHSCTVALSSRNILSHEKIDNALNEQFNDSNNSFFDSDDDSRVTDNLPAEEAIAIE
jgi:hypothetical protein